MGQPAKLKGCQDMDFLFYHREDTQRSLKLTLRQYLALYSFPTSVFIKEQESLVSLFFRSIESVAIKHPRNMEK